MFPHCGFISVSVYFLQCLVTQFNGGLGNARLKIEPDLRGLTQP